MYNSTALIVVLAIRLIHINALVLIRYHFFNNRLFTGTCIVDSPHNLILAIKWTFLKICLINYKCIIVDIANVSVRKCIFNTYGRSLECQRCVTVSKFSASGQRTFLTNCVVTSRETFSFQAREKRERTTVYSCCTEMIRGANLSSVYSIMCSVARNSYGSGNGKNHDMSLSNK